VENRGSREKGERKKGSVVKKRRGEKKKGGEIALAEIIPFPSFLFLIITPIFTIGIGKKRKRKAKGKKKTTEERKEEKRGREGDAHLVLPSSYLSH